MAEVPSGEVGKLSGVSKQLTPEESQIVDGESQVATAAPAKLIELSEPYKRIAPSPTGQYPAEAAEIITPEAGGVTEEEVVAEEGAPPAEAPSPIKVAFPILLWTRYAGADTDFQYLIAWNIPIGYNGDLHEISLQSDNDAKTRWRITIADVNMGVPTDRTLATPITWPWRDTLLPGPATVFIEVMSTDGTTINADASISGTLRLG